jgi:hypothetical protein
VGSKWPKLEKYKATFIENSVDGTELSQLNKSDLIDDYNFDQLHAGRLINAFSQAQRVALIKSSANPVGGAGTLHFQSPQLLKGSTPGRKDDVYAFGVVVTETVNRMPGEAYPNSLAEIALMKAVLDGKRPTDFTEPRVISGRCITLEPSCGVAVQHMWSDKREQRPSMADVVETMEGMMSEEKAAAAAAVAAAEAAEEKAAAAKAAMDRKRAEEKAAEEKVVAKNADKAAGSEGLLPEALAKFGITDSSKSRIDLDNKGLTDADCKWVAALMSLPTLKTLFLGEELLSLCLSVFPSAATTAALLKPLSFSLFGHLLHPIFSICVTFTYAPITPDTMFVLARHLISFRRQLHWR